MSAALELLGTASLLPPALLVLRAGLTKEMQAAPVVLGLRFPGEFDAATVEAFLVALTGLLPPWWRRLVVQPVITFELLADADGVTHRLVVPQAAQEYVERALQAHAPSVRVEPVTDTAWTPSYAVEYRATTPNRPLRVDPTGIASGLLAAVQPLRRSERLIVQWLVAAAGPVPAPRLVSTKGTQPTPPLLDSGMLATAEAVTARRKKLRAPLLIATGRVGALAANRDRAIALVRRVEGPLHGTRAPGAHLRRRLLPPETVAGRIARRSVPLLRWPALLNSEEAAGVIGWPTSSAPVPGLPRGGCRLLPVANAVPTQGTVLGTATFPGQAARPVALGLDARFRHLAVTGPTGVGKTTLLTHVAVQDLAAGHGLVVLDPKGDLVRSIAERLPEQRLEDVILLDPADDARPVGYNPLHATTSGNRELAVEQVLGVMHAIWQANWGPRTDEILRGCLTALAHVGGMTLCEVPALLTDAGFRRRVLRGVDDPFGVEGFWAGFEGWSDGERASATAPLLNKVRALTMRPRLRGILGQAEGAIDFGRIIARRQVLLVNLAVGQIGSEAAYLLGALLFAGLWDAVSARGHLPPERRPTVMAVIDEFQHVVALPTPAETILAEARSYRLGLTIAHQHLGQLDADLQHAVMANARSKLLFQAARDDAAVFARELGGGLTADDLTGIPAYEAVASCFSAGHVQPPTTLRTAPLEPPLRDFEAVRAASRQRWGVDRADVEAALLARQQGQHEPAPRIGRSPRRQP
ncbi:MAG: type IV secretory system conjugative DNA transfer family protein [Frankiaceae bacterium]